jgi:hypothetical protein
MDNGQWTMDNGQWERLISFSLWINGQWARLISFSLWTNGQLQTISIALASKAMNYVWQPQEDRSREVPI